VRALKHCCRGKAISITYCECVFVALGILLALCIYHVLLSSVVCLTVPYCECGFVALGILLAMCIYHVSLSSVVCLTLPYFSTLSRKCDDFRETIC
jgi:hypothetical protein